MLTLILCLLEALGQQRLAVLANLLQGDDAPAGICVNQHHLQRKQQSPKQLV